MDKISIIVPIYNVEKYLKRCLDSLRNQTYPNIEVVLVNDGSPDNSDEICKKYCNEDQRFVYFEKSNGGLSDARNFGVEKSTGDYITFVDSDDYVTDDYVEYLYALIVKYGTTMSICSISHVFTSNNKVIDFSTNLELKLNAKDCIEKLCYHDEVDTCAYAKLFAREICEKVTFPKGKIFEDIGTTYKFFEEAKEIACGFSSKYYYMIRDNSIVTSVFSPSKFDLLEMTDQMAIDTVKKYPDLKLAVLRRQVYARFSTLNQMLDVSGYNKEKYELIKFIQKHSKEVLQNKRTPTRDKIGILILKLGFPIYRFFWKSYLSVYKGRK